MAKKASFDGAEYDFGSQNQGGGAVSAAVAASPVQASDLLNPYKFSLVRVILRRVNPGVSFGLELASEGDQLIKVTKMGEAAAKAGLQADSYVLSIDGKRVKNETDYKAAERSSKPVLRVVCAKKRTQVLQPSAFPMPPYVQKQPARQYLLLRLNPSDGSRVGVGIGEKNGVVSVSQVVENSAGQQAGVRVGDRLLVIDDTPIENRDKCKTLVHQTAGNPFDLLVERAESAPAAASSPSPLAPAQTPTQAPVQAQKPTAPYDPYAGDPSAGVPLDIPRDVSVFVDEAKAKKTLQSIRSPVKKSQAKGKKSTSEGPRASAKLNKAVQSVLLKKTG